MGHIEPSSFFNLVPGMAYYNCMLYFNLFHPDKITDNLADCISKWGGNESIVLPMLLKTAIIIRAVS